MEPVSVDDLADRLEEGDDVILEILREDSMSLELYRLEAGATDPQDPHEEDEVYYVVAGLAKIRIGEETHAVRAGDVVFVERGVDHHFFDIEEDLVTLIVFAPPFSG